MGQRDAGADRDILQTSRTARTTRTDIPLLWDWAHSCFATLQAFGPPGLLELPAGSTAAAVKAAATALAAGRLAPTESARWVSAIGCPDEVAVAGMVGAASNVKASGNGHFKDKGYAAAVGQYTLGLSFLRPAGPHPATIAVRCSLLSNRAMCNLRLGEHKAVVADATAVLALDQTHIKSLMNRATALKELAHYAEAEDDIDAAARLCMPDQDHDHGP